MIELTTLHYVYLVFILLILGIMIKKRDCSLICIVGIFMLAIISTNSLSLSVIGVFNSFIYAITELLPTILIISIIVSLSKLLTVTGINEVMIRPFTKLIKNDVLAFWVIGITMMVISWFFWPSPAVALIGAIFVPVAIKAGLPAIGAAVAMNLFGHGIALSSDIVIQGAPKLTADAAGVPVSSVISATIPLIIVMGLVTTITAFILLKRDMKRGTIINEVVSDPSMETVDDEACSKDKLNNTWKIIFSLLIPILFIFDVILMIFLDLKGGDATALIGGTSIFLLMLISLKTFKLGALEKITGYFIDGFQFGFRVFGPVIPIAAFFYLGDMGFVKIIGEYLPQNSTGIVNDLGYVLAHSVPLNNVVSVATLSTVGVITGLDGSGFSGISLAGSIARLFATATGSSTATLTALGQICAIWVGGGTIIPWAIIPVAAVCKVSPFELARRNLVPVAIGIIATSIFALFLL
ncbi:TRAP-type C4-dicarboxylate transport system permease large subunit [Clostridium punense]|uniref:TRAP-type C4-dicarboxylate transport system permease large subunit n=1 Tax=Clostridium punense TaxID=1054297 RepID=A0ABS4K8J0_9CLOT|nr:MULTISPECIES: hypothetical protein [Clostridium]EQB89222.1 hypothetical protein M918_21345 [Clostridium sp. BL8]MBP2024084.1 TRAP-type C4-dicarboxylate transport system permease large subunit [Clostridium punense]